MSSSDFIDPDLLRSATSKRERALGGEAGGAGDASRYEQQRQQDSERLAAAARDLELLKERQEALERERRDLEDLRRKQETWTRGKKELMEHLGRSMVSLEREQLKATQLSEGLASALQKFRGLYREVDRIDENAWPADRVRQEIEKALATLDEARAEYNRSLARLEVLHAENALRREEGDPEGYLLGPARGGGLPGFGYWLKAGLAVTLPLILALAAAVVTLVYLFSDPR